MNKPSEGLREWTIRPHEDCTGAHVFSGDDFRKDEIDGYIDVIEKSVYNKLKVKMDIMAHALQWAQKRIHEHECIQDDHSYPCMEATKALKQWGEETPCNHAVTLDQLEATAIEKVYKEWGNNLTATAKHLGIGRATLYVKLKKYGLLKNE